MKQFLILLKKLIINFLRKEKWAKPNNTKLVVSNSLAVTVPLASRGKNGLCAYFHLR